VRNAKIAFLIKEREKHQLDSSSARFGTAEKGKILKKGGV